MSTEAERVFNDLRLGRPRALSRAISWVENEAPQAPALLEKIYAQAPHPWVIGITGVGGAGKSTLVPIWRAGWRMPAAGSPCWRWTRPAR